MASPETIDPTATSLALAAVTYMTQAVLSELRHWRRPSRVETIESSESREGRRASMTEMKLIEYKLEQLERERAYNQKWRHWMGNQIQRLMAKEGIECDPMPE